MDYNYDSDTSTEPLMSPETNGQAIGGSGTGTGVPSSPYVIRKPRCTVIVEPLFGALAFVNIGMFLLIEQYLYSRKARDYPLLTNGTSNETMSELCLNNSLTDENSVYKATQLVQASTAWSMMILTIVAAVPSLLSTLVIGGYSDTFYRKPALVLPTLGYFIRIAIMSSVIILDWRVEFIYAAAFVDGCFGSMGAMMMAVFSYMADIVEPESRAFRMVILDIITPLCGALAQSLIGVMIKIFGFNIPCYTILGVAFASLLYAILIVPETHAPLPGGGYFSLTEILTATYKVYSKKGARRFKLWMILFILLLPQLPILTSWAVTMLYQMHSPLCWGPDLIGIYMAFTMMVLQFGSVIGSMVFIRCFKLASIVVVLIGDISGVLSYGYFGFTNKTWQVFLAPVLGIFELLPLPVSRSIGSNLVDTSEQGALFSGMSILYTLASVGGALSFNTIYAVTLPWFRGTVFLICASLYLGSFILACFYMVLEKRGDYEPLPTIDECEPESSDNDVTS